MAILIKPLCPRCGKEEVLSEGTQTYEIELERPVELDIASEMRIANLKCGSCGYTWRLPGSIIEERG